mgnify:CR=1 FL=1
MTQAQTQTEASLPDPSHITAAGAESAKAGAELLANPEPEYRRLLTIEELGDLIFGDAVSDPSWTGAEGGVS